jgi:hypothetical protein
MSGLRHTVSIQDAGFIGEWLELAAFRWFVDASRYAATISKGDKLNRVVMIAHDNGDRPNWFQSGESLYDMEDAA